MTDNVEYVLHLNPDQAHETLKAVELLMRLKLNQYKELPFNLIPLGDGDFCKRRDGANENLEAAFKYIFPTLESQKKDQEWYRLYNLYQVLRKAIHDVERPTSCGVDSYPPIRLTEEPLPTCDIVKL
jgi:hypothetical protein